MWGVVSATLGPPHWHPSGMSFPAFTCQDAALPNWGARPPHPHRDSLVPSSLPHAGPCKCSHVPASKPAPSCALPGFSRDCLLECSVEAPATDHHSILSSSWPLDLVSFHPSPRWALGLPCLPLVAGGTHTVRASAKGPGVGRAVPDLEALLSGGWRMRHASCRAGNMGSSRPQQDLGGILQMIPSRAATPSLLLTHEDHEAAGSNASVFPSVSKASWLWDGVLREQSGSIEGGNAGKGPGPQEEWNQETLPTQPPVSYRAPQRSQCLGNK